MIAELLKTLGKLAADHPDAVVELARLATTVVRSPNPAETARRAALAAAAHATIEAL